MADITATAQAFRAEVVAGERAAASRLVRRYAQAEARINRDLEQILRRIRELRAKGETPGPAVLHERDRLTRLRATVIRESDTFAAAAGQIVKGEVHTAAGLGAAGAAEMVERVSTQARASRAAQFLTGAFETDTPLTALFAGYSTTVAAGIEDSLVSGLLRGANPRVLAREVRELLGSSLTRALVISRTEVMRAWRESARSVYRDNHGTLDGWVWISATDSRTCASCYAQHGSIHPLDEQMATHPSCRCVMAPAPRDDLMQVDPVPLGEDLFRKLPEATQREALGPSKFRAYRANQIRLPDLIARRTDPRWGPSTRVAGLEEAKQNARLRRAVT